MYEIPKFHDKIITGVLIILLILPVSFAQEDSSVISGKYIVILEQSVLMYYALEIIFSITNM